MSPLADKLAPDRGDGEGALPHRRYPTLLDSLLLVPARRALRQLLDAIGRPPLAFVLWNGQEVTATDAPVARVVFHDSATLTEVAANPFYAFGEAYADGRVDVEGDLAKLLTVTFQHTRAWQKKGANVLQTAARILQPRRNTLAASRENIHHHYDIGNDFYRLWLDEALVYTCAYFAQSSMTLEQAQRAKMDHICRKLRLLPGQSVIEAGCGWGAMALHMARHYGVNVRAFNISHEQITYARSRSREEGLDDQVEFIEDDWRNICGQCDSFVSVGMLEHVGLENYRLLGDVIDRCLTDDGCGLIHSIGRNRPDALNPWIEQRIFPGAYPPAMSEITNVLEPHRLSILDVENLRLHYAQTLRYWLRRYEDSIDQVHRMFDDSFARSWRLYLAGSIAAFESGDLQLFQILFTREANNDIPWTRAELYAEP